MAVSEVKQAEIERACTRLMLDYSHFADTGRFDDWANLFAEDAEFVAGGRTIAGRKDIRAMVAPVPDRVGMHVITNARVEVVSEDEAKGSVYFLFYAAAATNGVAVVKEIEPQIIGVYEDVYRKTAEGWRIARRGVAPKFTRPPPG